MMTASDLAFAGRKLHGHRWQTALARTLRVDVRTVRRWAAGERQVPATAELLIVVLLDSSDAMGIVRGLGAAAEPD